MEKKNLPLGKRGRYDLCGEGFEGRRRWRLLEESAVRLAKLWSRFKVTY